MLLCLTVDLPAKAKILDAAQFNGQFGCSVCKQEGQVVKVGRGTSRVFEYVEPPPPMRTHSECYSHGKKAVKQQKVSLLSITIPVTVYLHIIIL